MSEHISFIRGVIVAHSHMRSEEKVSRGQLEIASFIGRDGFVRIPIVCICRTATVARKLTVGLLYFA